MRIAALIYFADAAMLASIVLHHDIKRTWPRIVAALKMER